MALPEIDLHTSHGFPEDKKVSKTHPMQEIQINLVTTADTEHDLPFGVLFIILPAIRKMFALRMGHPIRTLALFSITPGQKS